MLASAFARPTGVHPLHLQPGGGDDIRAQERPRVDLAFLSLLGNDIGDEAAKAFARAVNTDDDRTDVALADRHVVRKRVRLFASDDPAKDVEA